MDRIETALATNDCVGDLRNWERRYVYHREFSAKPTASGAPEGWLAPDSSLIKIELSEADFEEFSSRRVSTVQSDNIGIDDRRYKVAFGQFDLTTGRLTVSFCGPNMG